MDGAEPVPVAELLYRRETFVIVLCIFTGLILWDFVICLPAEIKYIFYPEAKALLQRKRNRVAIPSLLLFLARLLVIPMIAVQLTIAHGQSNHCHAVYTTLLNLYSLIVANGTAVFIVRTVAIRSSKWPLKSALWTVWVAHTVLWFYASSTDISVIQLPREPFTATCLTHDLKSWTWLIYLANALFDVLILVLTLQTQVQDWNDVMHIKSIYKKTRSDLSQLFYRDALMYFVISVTVSFAIVGWIIQHIHDQFFTILIAPIHIWMHLTIPPRVIRTLKLHNAKANLSSLDYSINAQRSGQSQSQSYTNKTAEPTQQGFPFERSKTLQVSDIDDYAFNKTPRDERFASLHSSPVPELRKLDDMVVPFPSAGKEY